MTWFVHASAGGVDLVFIVIISLTYILFVEIVPTVITAPLMYMVVFICVLSLTWGCVIIVIVVVVVAVYHYIFFLFF